MEGDLEGHCEEEAGEPAEGARSLAARVRKEGDVEMEEEEEVIVDEGI